MLTMERPNPTAVINGAARPALLPRVVAALIDRLECGLIACDPSGRVYHVNAAARRDLQETHALRIVDGHVRCAPSLQEDWQRALHDAAVRHRSRLLPVEMAQGRLMLATMPLDVTEIDAPLVLVMMGRRQVCSPLGLELLASHHGLTIAESRVLRALVDNRSPREIAALHGVAIATIRTQISAVRDKLGVRSIDALLLRAAEMPPLSVRF